MYRLVRSIVRFIAFVLSVFTIKGSPMFCRHSFAIGGPLQNAHLRRVAVAATLRRLSLECLRLSVGERLRRSALATLHHLVGQPRIDFGRRLAPDVEQTL